MCRHKLRTPFSVCVNVASKTCVSHRVSCVYPANWAGRCLCLEFSIFQNARHAPFERAWIVFCVCAKSARRFFSAGENSPIGFNVCCDVLIARPRHLCVLGGGDVSSAFVCVVFVYVSSVCRGFPRQWSVVLNFVVRYTVKIDEEYVTRLRALLIAVERA